MTTDDLEPYEARVAAATSRLDDFYTQLVSELDKQNGGFRWWSGFSDWKTLTLLGDYLIQSVQGTKESLSSASLTADIHRQTLGNDEAELKAALRPIMEAGITDPTKIAEAIPQDAAARRRALTITESAESCIFHLWQTLDRVAAAAIIVGGFRVKDVATVYWSSLDGIATELSTGSIKEMLEPVGTPGRAVQEALVAPVLGWQQFGPDEWLLWLRDARHGLTHRSPSKKLNVTAGERLTRLFYRQPRWSEIQALVFGSKPPRRPIFDTFILKASYDVLDGLCESTAKLVAALVDAMVTCWVARRADPPMIVQHGRQWPTIEPGEPLSAFPGYGQDLTLDSRHMVVNTQEGDRWEAARIDDQRRRDWYE
ncbi:hypothetical protein A9X03_14205 [Mycobacterium sp. E1715]|uniref:hypothetical protein n=1 Tax=Mycobacterium sp. E1715 TaxID=1856863 RepID=UPI000800990C|nr:hypothetical protein [Mycobacterium sp. E1715]OBH23902.1 hypothetical protein A9X03_14205 [Mycobacterium sp. E1715]